MNLDKNIESSNAEPEENLTLPIARSGEQQFACILRNRSGMDAGEIDMGVRVFAIERLCDGDKQAICNTAYAMYEAICDHTGKTAKRDKRGQ